MSYNRDCSLKRALLFLMALTLWPVVAAAQTNASVRLALIAPEPALRPALDLLTVELSQNSGIALLERTEIERVLREQSLATASPDYLKLGQVLGADGLLVAATIKEGTQEFLGVRLVAVKPGVVLGALRSPWPVANLGEWTKGIPIHFAPLFPKLGVLAKDALPVSVVNLRAAVSSRETRELEQQLILLAIERLTRERELFVLERRRMELLSAEKELKDVEESAFWTGSYLLDGVIDRDGYSKERVTLHARLVPPAGGASVELAVEGPRTNAAGVVEKLTVKILETLKRGSSVAPWNPAEEAAQYFAEGTWAYRWKMLSEAQAAAEAAWALGKRTKDVAALRLSAYGDAILPRAVTGNIEIPALPQPVSLRAAVRTLSLFSQDYGLAMTTTNSLEEDWFDIGLYQALRPATAVLDGYYHAAELRVGNEEQLAELRSLARQVSAILETNVPGNRSANGRVERPARLRSSDAMRRWGLGDTLWRCAWYQGGLWFEKPEDALPMFHRILKAGYHPSDLPRVAGWPWAERKRVPGVMKQFLQQVCASTDPAIRLEGLYLAVVRAPFDAERQDRRCVEELIEAMWSDRERIWSSKDAAGLVPRTEAALDHKYYVWGGPAVEPFASFKKQFNSDSSRTGVTTNASDGRTNQAVASAAASRSTNRPVWPEEKPLVVKFVPWRLNGSHLREGLKSVLVAARVQDGKLWGAIQHSRPDDWITASRLLSFAVVDRATGSSEEIPFPNKVGWSDRAFAVSSDSLYATVGEQLHRYSFRNRTWEQISTSIPGGGGLLTVSNRLYVTTPENLLEFNPDSGQVQVLVSSRRLPPANEMDSRWKPGAFVYPARGDRLGVQLGDELYAFSRATRVWERLALLQFLHGKRLFRGSWIRAFESDEGVFFLQGVIGVQLFALWNGKTELEPLLESFSGVPWRPQTLLPTRWQWPEGLSLLDTCALAEGRNLWILCPRKSGVMHNEERVELNDERMATLLHFQPEFRDALCVPIQFEQDGRMVDAFEGFHRGFFAPGEKSPFWLRTPEGLVFAVPASPGHWLIANGALESRLQDLRKKLRGPAELKNQATTVPAGNAVTNAGAAPPGRPGIPTLKP